MYCWSKYLDEYFTIEEINVLNREKIFKAYYGFRVLYVFPFPSAGHWPLDFGSWQLRQGIVIYSSQLQWAAFPSPVTVKDQLTLIVVAVVDVIVALAAALFLPLLLVWVQMLIATISSLLFIGVISSSTATSLSSSTVCPCTAAAVLCLIVAVMGEGRWSFPLLFSGQSCNSGRSIVIVSFY